MVVCLIRRLMDEKIISVVPIPETIDRLKEYCCGLFDSDRLHFDAFFVAHDNGTTNKRDFAIYKDGSWIGIMEFHICMPL